MNDTIHTIMSRASVRAFEPRPLQAEDEEAVINAALRAPTAGNMMFYTVLRVKDAETRRKLSATCDNQPFIAQAPLTLIFLADFTRWAGLYKAAGVQELANGQDISWKGPSVADFLLCCCDAVIAAQNAVIAAQSLGIGSCYIGDIMEQYETHRELFRLPPQAFPIAMLVLGYPKGGRMPLLRPRFDAKYIVHDETYQSFTPQELLEMVGERSNSNVDPVKAVVSQFTRKQGAAFAREMARSAKAAMDAFLKTGGGEQNV